MSSVKKHNKFLCGTVWF